MFDFIANYCHQNDDRINHDLFKRTYDTPFHELIVDTCKGLDVIPGITLKGWRLERDQTKIHAEFDKKNSKDPRIRNNKALECLIQPGRTVYDMLYLDFHVEADGQSADVTRAVRVLSPMKNGLYIKNGRKVRVINQVVDNTTFVKDSTVQFKLKLYGVRLGTVRTKLKFVNDDAVACSSFRIDLLYKTANPLAYFLAEFGIDQTIRFFGLESMMAVVDARLDEEHYLYLKLSKTRDIYLEVHEKAFYSHEFVATFTGTLYDILSEDKDVTFRDIYDQDYWLCRLSEIFSKKRYVDKGRRVLISFRKIFDDVQKRKLALPKKHKKTMFNIVRWMMSEYPDLLKKDSHNLENKRVRANETMAYSFDKHISMNVYSLLNTDKPSFERHLRLLKSINEWSFLRGAHGGQGKGSQSSMFRQERYNDFDAIEIARYTLAGPTGINGDKNSINLEYRDIYTSHLGRYDINVCMASNPGITGFLCANVKLSPKGYFDPDGGDEPDSWFKDAAKIAERVADPNYYDSRRDYVEVQLNRDEDGVFRLHRKPTEDEVWCQLNVKEDKTDLGLYQTETGWHLIPKMPRDAKGHIVIAPKKEQRRKRRETEEDLFKNGPIVLKPIVNKATKLGIRIK